MIDFTALENLRRRAELLRHAGLPAEAGGIFNLGFRFSADGGARPITGVILNAWERKNGVLEIFVDRCKGSPDPIEHIRFEAGNGQWTAQMTGHDQMPRKINGVFAVTSAA